jgi:hypothetical protein
MKAWMYAFLIAACSKGDAPKPPVKTTEQLKQEWGAKVSAKLEKIVAAAKAANGADLAGDAKLTLDFDWDDPGRHPNAIAVQIDDVQSATEHRPEPKSGTPSYEEIAKKAEAGEAIMPPGVAHPRFTFQDDGTSHVYKAKTLVGVIKEQGQYPEYVYDQLVNAKYVLVVTPGEVTWPSASGEKFQGGTAAMRAVLVEIETAKPLGGFEAVGVSSDKVFVRASANDDQLQSKLDADLIAESGRAIVKGIEQRWPGAKTPLDYGHTW